MRDFFAVIGCGIIAINIICFVIAPLLAKMIIYSEWFFYVRPIEKKKKDQEKKKLCKKFNIRQCYFCNHNGGGDCTITLMGQQIKSKEDIKKYIMINEDVSLFTFDHL